MSDCTTSWIICEKSVFLAKLNKFKLRLAHNHTRSCACRQRTQKRYSHSLVRTFYFYASHKFPKIHTKLLWRTTLLVSAESTIFFQCSPRKKVFKGKKFHAEVYLGRKESTSLCLFTKIRITYVSPVVYDKLIKTTFRLTWRGKSFLVFRHGNKIEFSKEEIKSFTSG